MIITEHFSPIPIFSHWEGFVYSETRINTGFMYNQYRLISVCTGVSNALRAGTTTMKIVILVLPDEKSCAGKKGVV